ncbi:Uncharacterised protein [Mycobacteroides abscessus subsp. abscessus]|nr:Uncharacterised protein [Mycobacteroides abscessus subsp. abscessus]
MSVTNWRALGDSLLIASAYLSTPPAAAAVECACW